MADRDPGESRRRPPKISVPVLNDYLLYADPDWRPDHDLPLECICWKPVTGPDTINVIPSSALPLDVARTMPVIFDEQFSAYLEGRLERLLDQIAARHPTSWVVFDVPPTIPGLSRAVASLALRYGGPGDVIPLAKGGTTPTHLGSAEVRWRACLVASMDVQDRRAILRWVQKILPEEEAVFQVVVNRSDPGQKGLWDGATETLAPLDSDLPPTLDRNPLLDSDRRIHIDDDERLRVFRDEAEPPPEALEHVEPLLDLVRR